MRGRQRPREREKRNNEHFYRMWFGYEATAQKEEAKEGEEEKRNEEEGRRKIR